MDVSFQLNSIVGSQVLVHFFLEYSSKYGLVGMREEVVSSSSNEVLQKLLEIYRPNVYHALYGVEPSC
jgi:hypothetical protein